MKKVAAALIVLALLAARAVAGDVRPIVVEVYTSQGCNSCLAANNMAGKVAQRPGLLVLSFPVTYWDMFGWKDTLASDDNTKRQKAYAGALRRGGVYTPQMIVDGVKDVPAAREDAVSYALTLAAMARDDGMQSDFATPAVARRDGLAGDVAFVAAMRVKTPARSAWSVGVPLSKRPGDLRVVVDRVPDAGQRGNIDATVWLFRLRSTAAAKIGGGENSGQTIAYRNVVTSITNAGRWRGEPLTIDVPKVGPKGPVHDAVAVVVQQGGYGRIVGAALVGNATFYAPW